MVLDKDTLKMTNGKSLLFTGDADDKRYNIKTKSLLFCVFIYGHLCIGKLWFALHVSYHSLFATYSGNNFISDFWSVEKRM